MCTERVQLFLAPIYVWRGRICSCEGENKGEGGEVTVLPTLYSANRLFCVLPLCRTRSRSKILPTVHKSRSRGAKEAFSVSSPTGHQELYPSYLLDVFLNAA
jgi:hypothetical protein